LGFQDGGQFLHFFDIVVDSFWIPELAVSVYSPVEEVVVVVVLSVGLNIEQVPVGLLFLVHVVVPGDLEFRSVEVDSLLD
jgi:hypothetical protein